MTCLNSRRPPPPTGAHRDLKSEMTVRYVVQTAANGTLAAIVRDRRLISESALALGRASFQVTINERIYHTLRGPAPSLMRALGTQDYVGYLLVTLDHCRACDPIDMMAPAIPPPAFANQSQRRKK